MQIIHEVFPNLDGTWASRPAGVGAWKFELASRDNLTIERNVRGEVRGQRKSGAKAGDRELGSTTPDQGVGPSVSGTLGIYNPVKIGASKYYIDG